MIVSTTPTIEGKKIIEYKGIIAGETIMGVNFLKDIMASFSDFLGGRSSTYENELINGRMTAIDEMKQRARELGANAVVGVDIDYEVLGQNGSMLMVTACGTAVVVE